MRYVGVFVFAVVAVGLLAILLFAIFGQRPTGSTVVVPTPTTTATTAATPPPTSTPAATHSPSPPPSPAPTVLYVNSTYKFSVMLPAPYRPSARLSMTFVGSTRPASQDVFTARTDADEASINTSGCHTACPLWQYAAYVIVNTGVGPQTPRQYYALQGGSVSQVIEDTLVDGRTAISVTNGVPFPMQFIVKDADRMVVVAYQLYPPESGMAVPVGATKEKLDSILASFHFTP